MVATILIDGPDGTETVLVEGVETWEQALDVAELAAGVCRESWQTFTVESLR